MPNNTEMLGQFTILLVTQLMLPCLVAMLIIAIIWGILRKVTSKPQPQPANHFTYYDDEHDEDIPHVDIEQKPPIIKITLAASALLIALCAVFGAVLYTDAIHKGAYSFENENIIHIMRCNNDSPVDQSAEMPETPTNLLVYFYRWDCPDCLALHSDLKTWMEQTNIPCKSVSSRSAYGLLLKQESILQQVPSIAYFDNEGIRHMQIVYKNKDDGTPYIDEDALNALSESIATANAN